MPNSVKSNSRTVIDKRIITAGEIFPDGTVIELVAGSPGREQPMLMLWNGRRKASIGAQVTYGGRIYEAPVIDPILYRAMRLPARTEGYASVRHLFEGVAGLFTQHMAVSQPTANLLAAFAMSTWLRHWLPEVLHLAFCGWQEELGVDVLRLLQCVCRRPILVGEITAAWLRTMPTHLSPALLVNQTKLRPSLQRLLWTSCHPGLYVPGNGGGLAQLYGAKAIFCPDAMVMDAVGGDVIKVLLTRSDVRRISLDEKTRQEIGDHFQPRLLLYRLRRFSSGSHVNDIDVSQFAPVMQPCASLLAQCFIGDPKLAHDATQLLVPQDEEIRRNPHRVSITHGDRNAFGHFAP